MTRKIKIFTDNLSTWYDSQIINKIQIKRIINFYVLQFQFLIIYLFPVF